MSGVEDVGSDIHARGEVAAVITMPPDFFAHHLSAWGFDDVIASVFPTLPFVAAVDPDKILTPQHKVQAVEELLRHYGLERSRCVAYGYSMWDAPRNPMRGIFAGLSLSTVTSQARRPRHTF